MSIGPFLWREAVTSVRSGSVFSYRRGSVLMTAAVVAVFVVNWDWQGRDRTSISGAASFSLQAFTWIVGVQTVLALGMMPALVAPRIASERDRKSLDSLLATRFSASEIVLGNLGAGLLCYLNSMAGLAPILVLLVFLGGIDPRLVLLAVAAILSTAFALASLSIAVSAGARTKALAIGRSTALALTWLLLPALVVVLGPRLWRAGASLVTPVALHILDSSPVGVLLSQAGVLGRGPLLEVLLRMIALQSAASVLFLAWGIIRLRPASRAAYDVASSSAARAILRARWRPRPPCGDDPVLWHEMHAGRLASPASLWVDRLCHILWLGLLIYGLSWAALPAFAEVREFGYGPSPTPNEVPEVNPLIRILVSKFTPSPIPLAPGHARLEFNVVTRQLTGILVFLYVMMIAGTAAESVANERDRDTWLGLITTPLTGGEILRAKMIGSVWRVRGVGYFLLGLWVVALAAGAVHPLGLLATLLAMGVSCWLLAAFGVAVSVRSRDRSQATSRVLGVMILALSLGAVPFLSRATAGAVVGSVTTPFQAWVFLVSYDDVHSWLYTGAMPGFAQVDMATRTGTAVVIVACLVGVIAQGVAAFLLTRYVIQSFDAVVGRPVRGRMVAARDPLGPLPSHSELVSIGDPGHTPAAALKGIREAPVP